jgi:hypothetical protein
VRPWCTKTGGEARAVAIDGDEHPLLAKPEDESLDLDKVLSPDGFKAIERLVQGHRIGEELQDSEHAHVSDVTPVAHRDLHVSAAKSERDIRCQAQESVRPRGRTFMGGQGVSVWARLRSGPGSSLKFAPKVFFPLRV